MTVPARFAYQVVLTCLACLASCGGEERDNSRTPEAPTPERSAPVAEARQESTRRAPPLPASMQRASRVVTFAHEPHMDLDCATCHARVPGHGSHASVSCRTCHASGDDAPATAPPPETCLACHHGADQPRACADCHEPVAPLVAMRPVHLGVWPGPRSRGLPFEHARHEPADCTTCHVTRPALEASLDCATCHASHHRADASCLGCHPPPREGAHALDAHLGCGGAGCHSDPVVQALPQSRPFCLVCHQDQVEHNPGRDCADCHQVSGAPAAGPRPW